jgi:PAS domain S-box-containing protein
MNYKYSQNSDLYNELIDFHPISVCDIDIHGNIIYANKTAYETFQYTEGDLGINIIHLIHDDDKQRALQNISNIVENERSTIHHEYKMIKKDGSIIHVLVNSSPISINDKSQGIRTIITDISEKIKTENELKKAKNFLELIFHTIPSAIFTVDNNKIITSWNKKAEEITGYSDKELIGKPCIFFNSITCGSSCQLLDSFPPSAIENKICHLTSKIGKKIIIFKNASFLRDENGNIIGGIESFYDITKQKQLDQEKKELQEKLNHSQKLEAIGQLAGGIAHDFNNQLGVIHGYGEMIYNRSKENSLERKYASLIVKASEYSSNLTEQMLAFARKGKYRSIDINIHKMINELAKVFERSFDKNIEISLYLESNSTNICGDPSLLENLFLNIGINARDAMPEGGKLTISSETVEFNNNCNDLELEAGKYILIKIADSGIGIDKSISSKVFEPFFTTKPVGKGTGMGLSSAYGTVKNHNGAIYFDSQTDKGTIFNIYLPSNIKDNTSKTTKTSTLEGTGNIMIIDDDDNIRDLLEVQLEEIGYKPHIFENGIKALDFYKQNHENIDVILLDIVMKEIRGSKLFYQLKSINSNVKIIVLSGLNLNDEINMLIADGVISYIQKPYSINDLSQKINNIIHM